MFPRPRLVIRTLTRDRIVVVGLLDTVIIKSPPTSLFSRQGRVCYLKVSQQYHLEYFEGHIPPSRSRRRESTRQRRRRSETCLALCHQNERFDDIRRRRTLTYLHSKDASKYSSCRRAAGHELQTLRSLHLISP